MKKILYIIYITAFFIRIPNLYAEDISSTTPEQIIEEQILETPTEPILDVLDTTSSTTENNIAEQNTLKSHIYIRVNDNEIIDTDVEFDQKEVLEIKDIENISHNISTSTVLHQLILLDNSTESFNITSIKYYDYMGSFYLRCISVSGIEYCDNWQYLINGATSYSSIDQAFIRENDSITLYFGDPYRVTIDAPYVQGEKSFFIKAGEPFNAHAQTYLYKTNTWGVRTGVTLGITQENPDDMWNPIEIMTSNVDEQGAAIFTLATSGKYFLGVKDDWYYPTIPLSVSTGADDISTSTITDSSGGKKIESLFDIEKALNFIKSFQSTTGSYGGAELYSDWVAIAFNTANFEDTKLAQFISSRSNIKNIVTENERRAMAILSYGKNPYTYNGINYIKTIVDSFDGVQIGESDLINDDIFGLLVLGKSGYGINDIEIQKTISFILSKQRPEGSWENSYDLTAAAIQALSPFQSISGVSDSIKQAKDYLKNTQESDGGWGSVYTTAWVAQAMYESGENWIKNSNSVQDYFAQNQQADGGVLDSDETNQNRIWATSYVIPAVLEKSWNDILKSVSKPKQDTNSSTEESATTTIPSIEEHVNSDIEIEEYNATSSLEYFQEEETSIKKNTPSLISNSEQIIDTSSRTPEDAVSFEDKKSSKKYFEMWWVFAFSGVVFLFFGLRFLIKNI